MRIIDGGERRLLNQGHAAFVSSWFVFGLNSERDEAQTRPQTPPDKGFLAAPRVQSDGIVFKKWLCGKFYLQPSVREERELEKFDSF